MNMLKRVFMRSRVGSPRMPLSVPSTQGRDLPDTPHSTTICYNNIP